MNAWTGFLPVAAGGAIGACLRYGIGLMLPVQAAAGRFPWATCLVNIAGCALAGIFLAWWLKAPESREFWRLLVMVGVLGGFTTFSAFGVETWQLLRAGAPGVAVAYVLVSVFGGILAVVVAARSP